MINGPWSSNLGGWFKLHAHTVRLLLTLPDGAFKLAMWILTRCRRKSGDLTSSIYCLAESMGKAPSLVAQDLDALAKRNVLTVQECHDPDGLLITIADQYWPYRRTQEFGMDEGRVAYVKDVLGFLHSWACIDVAAAENSRDTALEFFEAGIDINTVKQAILLGVSRREMQSSRVKSTNLIGSLEYFRRLIAEVKKLPSMGAYWEYLEFRLKKLKRS